MMDKATISQALKLAGLKNGETFYDLGCGNGEVLIEAAKTGANVMGFEISPYYYILAKIRTARFSNIEVYYQNIFKSDFSRADVVYCYLMPEMLKKLRPKFRMEMKKGRRVISIGFPIPKMKSLRETKIYSHKVFIY